MADLLAVSPMADRLNPYKFAFPDRNVDDPNLPYNFFRVEPDQAEKVVKQFIEKGGPAHWTEYLRGKVLIGAEKEIFVVQDDEKSKTYAIRRGRHDLNRESFPRVEVAREARMVRNGKLFFAPSIIVKDEGGPYSVREFVTGERPTGNEVNSFQRIHRITLTDEGNLIKHPQTGIVLLDLADMKL